MKPIIFLMLFGFVYSKTNGQKIYIDKTDPFTNLRHIATDNGKLVVVSGIKVLQTSCAREILPAANEVYTISFLNLSTGVTAISRDSAQFSCLLKGANGKVYTGTWLASSQGPVGTETYQISSYSIAKSDALEISATEIVAVKFTGAYYGGMFEIAEKYRKQIPKQLTLLASVR